MLLICILNATNKPVTRNNNCNILITITFSNAPYVAIIEPNFLIINNEYNTQSFISKTVKMTVFFLFIFFVVHKNLLIFGDMSTSNNNK